MTVRLNGKIRMLTGLGIIAAGAVGLAALTSPAYADTNSVLKASADTLAPIAPGESGVLHHEVENTGTVPTSGLLINFQLPKHVALDEDEQCEPKGSTPNGGTLISCLIVNDNGTLEPGEILNTDVAVHVAQDAPEATKLGDIVVTTVPLDAEGEPTEDPTKLDGPNTVRIAVESVGSDKSYDLSVAATEATGKVGDTVTITGSSANKGPDDVAGAKVIITAPKGTELANSLSDCTVVEEKRKLVCETDAVLKAGHNAGAELKFKIVDSTVGNDGSITISTKMAGKDTNSDNNTAPITIKVAGGAGTGGGNSDDDDEQLPATGANLPLVAGSGAVALLAGGALLMLARRRNAVDIAS